MDTTEHNTVDAQVRINALLALVLFFAVITIAAHEKTDVIHHRFFMAGSSYIDCNCNYSAYYSNKYNKPINLQETHCCTQLSYSNPKCHKGPKRACFPLEF